MRFMLVSLNTGRNVIKAITFFKRVSGIWKKFWFGHWIATRILYHTVCVCDSTCVNVYLFKELYSVPQALYLLGHILHRAEPSTYRNHTDTDMHQRMASKTPELVEKCVFVFLRSEVYISEESFEHFAMMNPCATMIHGHCSVSILQTRKRTTEKFRKFRARGESWIW